MPLLLQIFEFRHRRFVLAALLLLGITMVVGQVPAQQKAQQKEQLELQMKKLRKEIADMEKQLEKTRNQKQENLEQLNILKEKIEKREKLIENYTHQLSALEESISATAKDIDRQNSQIEVMKQDYAKMLRTTYSNLAIQNEWTFIISASSFNEAIARYGYLKRISEYRKQQAVALQASIDDLTNKKTRLERNKKRKEGLLVEQNQEKGKLEEEKGETDKMIAQLGEKEKKMKRYVDDKNKAAMALNSKIQKIIEEEIRQARKKAEDASRKQAAAQAKANPGTPVKPQPKQTIVLLTPKEQELSKDFASNKGHLPWPVAKGTIIAYFGKREHPTLKGVFIENNGLDIKTADGSNARSIFGGSVVSVFTLPTTQTCIIVKHGDYFSVYSNIMKAAVSTNDNLIARQNIGTLFLDKSESLTKVHLEIWRGKDKLNPAEWISAN
ncbi:MAG: peptidoglycan DD-metalloendopeptidase family protein [Chitinophagales bacterium]